MATNQNYAQIESLALNIDITALQGGWDDVSPERLRSMEASGDTWDLDDLMRGIVGSGRLDKFDELLANLNARGAFKAPEWRSAIAYAAGQLALAGEERAALAIAKAEKGYRGAGAAWAAQGFRFRHADSPEIFEELATLLADRYKQADDDGKWGVADVAWDMLTPSAMAWATDKSIDILLAMAKRDRDFSFHVEHALVAMQSGKMERLAMIAKGPNDFVCRSLASLLDVENGDLAVKSGLVFVKNAHQGEGWATNFAEGSLDSRSIRSFYGLKDLLRVDKIKERAAEILNALTAEREEAELEAATAKGKDSDGSADFAAAPRSTRRL